MNFTATFIVRLRAFAIRVFSVVLIASLSSGWTASHATLPKNFKESPTIPRALKPKLSVETDIARLGRTVHPNRHGSFANGTLTFSNNTGLGDGIASDGEGGSMDLPGIAIDIFNISDVNGTDVGQIDWRDDGFFGVSYNGLTYEDISGNGTKGMAIKSRDGSEFQINGFDYFNWGETDDVTITVRGYRGGSVVTSITFNGNSYDESSPEWPPISVPLNSTFDYVDEVRLYISAGGYAGDQSATNHSINNIVIADAVMPSPVITGHPFNRTICNGENTTFSVTATNATSYQWQENSGAGFVNITDGGIYSGATTATLTFAGATSAMSGYQYRVRAINAGGFATSNPTALTVITVSLSGSQTNVTTGGGNDGTATVTPSGGIMPYTYSWSPSGGTAATATGLTAGIYTVLVTDNIGCQATYEFTILEPPTLTNIGGPMNFTENGGATRIVASNATLTADENITGMTLVLAATPNGASEAIVYSASLNGGSSLASLGLSGNYNSAIRTYTVSGDAPPAVYQNVLRAMVYNNSSESPETTARSVAISATHTSGLTGQAIATINITAVNDAPTATNLTQSKAATEGGSAVALDDIVVSDVDAGEIVTATLTLSDAAAGTLSTGTYGSVTSTFNAGTGVWTATGSVPDVNAALAAVALTPSADNDQNFTITTRIRDAADTGPADGTISVTVTAVNDAPVLNPSVTLALDAIDEDAGSPVNGVVSGTLVSTLVGGISDPDTDALKGIAIVAADATNGSWWFSINDGDSWSVLGTPSASPARLLAADATTRVHFRPNADWNGSIASAVTIRAWDRTGGTNGGQANISVVGTGGTTPFSTATATVSLTVNPVADAPTATNMTQTKSTIEDSGTITLDDMVVTDPDAGETVTATLTLSGAAAGTLSTGTYGSVTSTFNAGTGVWTATGSVPDVNAALAAVAFTPSIDYDQNFTITTRVRDAAGTGPADGTISVAVTAVNDVPAITAPATIAVTEDVSAALTGISFSDVDAGSGTVTATLSVPSGSLSATSGSGVVVGGTASALTLSGTIADVNAFIAASNVTHTTALNATGNVTLTVEIDDNGNTGTGGAQSESETVTLQVTAVNDAPVITTPATIAVTEDVSTALTGISFADVDAGSGIVTVTLSVPSGSLSTTSGSGVTVGGTASALTLSGTIADVNAFIAASNVTYTTALNATGNVTLTVSIDDNGNTGAGGAQSANETITLQVTAINDAPVITIPATIAVTEDVPAALTGISFADVDAGSGTVTATLSVPSGSLSATGGSGVTVGGTANALTLSGTIADVNAFIAASNVTYTTALNATGNVTLTAEIDDNGNTGTGGAQEDSGTITLQVTAVNDSPSATNLTQAKTAAEGGSAVALDDIVVTDPDAGETITATLTMSDATAGSLTTGTFGSATSTFNAGTGVWTVTGSVADVNAALAGAAFTPSVDNEQNFTIATRVRDAADTGPADGTISVTVTPVNDAPTATNLTQSKAATEDGPAVALDDIVVSDVDAGETVTATFTLSNAAAGTLSTGTYGSATSTFNPGTGTWTVTGSVADVNAALAAVAFTPSADNDQNFTITTRIRDAASTGPADGTIMFTVTAVNDAPTTTGTPDISVNQDAAYSFIPVGDDIDGDALTFSITNKPDWADFNTATGALTGTPGNADVGSTTDIVITVSDGILTASLPAFDLEVVNVNDAPTITGTPDISVNQDVAYSFIPTGNDIDGNTLTFSIANKPDWADFDTATGALTGTPGNEDVGLTTGIVITVSDGTLSANLPAFDLEVVNVNDAPTISGTPATNVNQDAAYVFIPVGDDIDEDALTFGITNKPDWADFDTATGELNGTPGNEDVGLTTGIVITVSDGTLSANLPAFDLEVVNVNDAPTISGTPATNVNQDAAYSFIPVGNDIDAGTVLEYSIANKPDWADFDAGTGELSGTPGNADVGITTGIVITVSDGTLSANLPAFDLEVINVNDAPTITGTPDISVNQDAAYSFSPVGNDIDAGTVLEYRIANKPDWADFNTATGELNGTPGNADVGITTDIVISVSDGTLTASLPAFDLEVVNVNDAPTISGTPATNVNQDAAYSFIPVGNDIDAGTVLEYSIANKPDWADFDAGTGELSGTPGNADVGSTTGIVITVSDGTLSANLPAFDLEVINVNDAPTITGTPDISVNQDAAYSFIPVGNDIDAGTVLEYSIANKPDWADFDAATGELNGTSGNADVGITTGIVITVSDGTLTASLPAFDLEVISTNDAPTITGVPAASVKRGAAYRFEPSATDSDGDALAFAIANKPGWATFSTATGALSGIPQRGDEGQYGNIVISVYDGTVTAALPVFAIEVAEAEPITGITLGDASFTYDGRAKSLAIVGDLPEGTTVSYTGNSRTDVGSQPVTARIAGGLRYEDLELTATLRITPGARALDFPALAGKTYGDADFEPGATASSGEGISYTSGDPTVAEIAANGQIRITGAGETTITATVPENGNYANRPESSRTLVVNKATQSISFNPPAEVNRDAGSLALDVEASSGLPVTLSIDDGQVATVDGTTLNILRLGTVRITATQAGDANHQAAEPVTVAVRVVDPSSDFPVRVHPAVSPNGDGINEFLIIEGIRDHPDNRVTIFNRNGTIVWEGSGYDNDRVAFRGIGTGRLLLPAGTYFYVVEIGTASGTEYRKGYFVLRY